MTEIKFSKEREKTLFENELYIQNKKFELMNKQIKNTNNNKSRYLEYLTRSWINTTFIVLEVLILGLIAFKLWQM